MRIREQDDVQILESIVDFIAVTNQADGKISVNHHVMALQIIFTVSHEHLDQGGKKLEAGAVIKEIKLLA